MSTVDNLQQNIDLYNSWLVAWHSGRTSDEGVRNSTRRRVELRRYKQAFRGFMTPAEAV